MERGGERKQGGKGVGNGIRGWKGVENESKAQRRWGIEAEDGKRMGNRSRWWKGAGNGNKVEMVNNESKGAKGEKRVKRW